VRSYVEQVAKSICGVNNINSSEISRIPIHICDLKAQWEIVQEIESRISVCDSIEQTVDTALQQSEAMRQSI
jgi:type I restriction enzyme S subunit